MMKPEGCGTIKIEAGPLDSALKYPKLYLECVERHGRLLDVGHR